MNPKSVEKWQKCGSRVSYDDHRIECVCLAGVKQRSENLVAALITNLFKWPNTHRWNAGKVQTRIHRQAPDDCADAESVWLME